MMKTLADGMAALQANVRAMHTSGIPERRQMLAGTVELFRADVFGPIDLTTALAMPLGQLLAIGRRYSATRQSEQAQRDACVAEFEVVLYRLAAAAERAELDPSRAMVRPDFDASPTPNPIGQPVTL